MINYPLGTNGNLLFIGVQIFKHITVIRYHVLQCRTALVRAISGRPLEVISEVVLVAY